MHPKAPAIDESQHMVLNMSNTVEQDLDVTLAGVGVSRLVRGLDLYSPVTDMTQCDETHPVCERKISINDQSPFAHGCISRVQKGWERLCIPGENNADKAKQQ